MGRKSIAISVLVAVLVVLVAVQVSTEERDSLHDSNVGSPEDSVPAAAVTGMHGHVLQVTAANGEPYNESERPSATTDQSERTELQVKILQCESSVKILEFKKERLGESLNKATHLPTLEFLRSELESIEDKLVTKKELHQLLSEQWAEEELRRLLDEQRVASLRP